MQNQVIINGREMTLDQEDDEVIRMEEGLIGVIGSFRANGEVMIVKRVRIGYDCERDCPVTDIVVTRR